MTEAIVKLIDILVRTTFAALVFTLASDITIKGILSEIKQPLRLLRISLVSVVLVPAVTAVIFKFFNANIVVTVIALVAAGAPGDSFSLFQVVSKKAHIALAATLMAWFCILSPFTVPIWLALVSKFFPLHLEASPLAIFLTVVPLTIFPLALGVFLRELFPAVSDILKKITGSFFKFSILIVMVGGFVFAVKGLSHFTAQSVMATCAAVTAALFMGYYCGLPDRKDRLTSALMVSLGNFALVILVVHISYPKANIISEAVVFVIIRWLVIMIWYFMMRQIRLKRDGTL